MTDFSYPSRPASDWASILAAMRRALALAMAALHYGLVWLVWLALFIVRPRLALESFRYRRMDSPIGRGRRAVALTRLCRASSTPRKLA